MSQKTLFSLDDAFVDINHPSMKYRRRNKEQKRSVAWGQRKLFLSEVYFLTWHADQDNPLVVYAGAAPGTHIPFLATMFPEIEWHLYDPRPFTIKSTSKIHLYQQYFMDEDAQRWANKKVLFISDIRTADHHRQEKQENESSVIDDLRMQERWYEIMNPHKAYLKFRLPYYEGYENGREFQYLSGQVVKQPWAPQSSTETRLIPDGKKTRWDLQKYEEQMFYHNAYIREKIKYQCTPLGELLNDFDSCFEREIFDAYLESRSGNPETRDQDILAMSNLLTKNINLPGKRTLSLTELRKDPLKIKRHFNRK